MKFFEKSRAGFTLLELLAVMGILALLGTLAITSYFGAVRGMARRSASEHFLNALTQARQRACVDGTRVSVIVYNQVGSYDAQGKLSTLLPTFVVCREIGRVSFVQGNFLFDEYSDLKQLFGEKTDSTDELYSSGYKGELRLYNLSKGFWTTAESRVTLRQFGSGDTRLWGTLDSHSFEDYAFTLTGDKSSSAVDWSVGDSYGVEVAPPLNLPKTFRFKNIAGETVNESDLKRMEYVTFGPDGSSVAKGGGGRSVTFTIESSDKQMAPIKFTINSQGMITHS